MTKEKLPEITGTNYAPAAEFTREYKLTQWRVTAYIKAVADLYFQEGKLPTDTSIARSIDDKRTKQGTRLMMMKIAKLGLVKELHETEQGYAYQITEKGEQARTRIRQIERSWQLLHEQGQEPPVTDYSGSFRRYEREQRHLNEIITAKNEIIEYQVREIQALKAEIAQLRGGLDDLHEDTVPFPL